MEKTTGENRVRKRAPNACARCRRQKIKCVGPVPCEQCTKRNLTCNFDERSQKILVTKGFISSLQRRIASLEGSVDDVQDQTEETEENEGSPQSGTQDDWHFETVTIAEPETEEDIDTALLEDLAASIHSGADNITPVPQSPNLSSESQRSFPASQLMNPLALGASTYIPGPKSRPVYLGPSSNWSFGRRVLAMTYENLLGLSLPTENLHFEGEVYDLGWDGQRSSPTQPSFDPGTLPSPDFAIYLINAVKFHCGQMFHLFDEKSFMEQFFIFHDVSADKSRVHGLWYVHYLLIIAFGKAFVVRSNKGRRPPGAEFFSQAMKLLPDVTFLCTNPAESIEVFCCAALYLQSLDYRMAAHCMVGQALRIALGHGMHTDMKSQHMDPLLVQRYKKVWWTVYVLDRQISALMGLPLSIRDEDISAELPAFPDSEQRTMALDLHVKLSRVTAQICNTVYSTEGRLNEKFLNGTKAALKDVADLTDQLNSSFNLAVNGSHTGFSRLSAYLHLLHHQCIILATRPLLFRFLEVKLDARENGSGHVPQSGNTRALLQMCMDSAQQMLEILVGLQEQSLLESFLPFDLDATFASAIVLLMAPAIDPTLLDNPTKWKQRAYGLLEEMSFRGNLIAGFLRKELQQLDSILNRFQSSTLPRAGPSSSRRVINDDLPAYNPEWAKTSDALVKQPYPEPQPINQNIATEKFYWQDPLTTEQVMMVADALDLESMNWLSATFDQP